MDAYQIIAGLKALTRPEAESHALPLMRADGTQAGALVPIGPWALTEPGLVEAFTQWRQMFMRFFQSQFKATPKSMMGYLEKMSISEADRIFFAVYDQEVGLVGHIGLSNVTDDCAELDNIIRGVSGGDAALMRMAEGVLLGWAFSDLGVTRIEAQVLSFNFMAHDLHASFGFALEQSFPLCRDKDGLSVSHTRVDPAKANVDYKLDLITLTPQSFRPL